MPELSYPESACGDHIDYFHGVAVPDPYKWMEETEDPEIKRWLKQQNELTDAHIENNQNVEALSELFARMPGFVPDTLPVKRGERTFFFAQGQEQSEPLLVMAVDAKEDTILAPGLNGLKSSLKIYREFVYVSPKGNYVAFAAADGAADSQSLYLWDVDRRCLIDSPIPPIGNPVVAWLPDESGFFYNVTHISGFTPGAYDGVYLHVVGSENSQDKLIFSYRDGEGHAALPYIPVDGHFLFIKTINFVTQKAGLVYAKLQDLTRFITLFEDTETKVNLIGVSGTYIFLESRLNAANGCVLKVDLKKPQREHWHTLIPEQQYPISRTTQTVHSTKLCLSGSRLFVTYSIDASEQVHMFSLDGTFIKRMSLPDICSVNEIQAGEGNGDAAFHVTSFLTPYLLMYYHEDSGELSIKERLSAGVEADDFVIRQTFCPSFDSTNIPITIIQAKHSTTVDKRPVLLYGYGGWGQTITPEFRPDLIAWVALGGTYVIANIRGGGEYGDKWHEAGRLMHKQNVFADFCSVAEYLIDKKIATKETLAIRGLSNGGLLTTSCLNRRPDLFAAVIAEVPLVDTVHLMDLPIGPAVAAELGDPTSDKQTFDYMLEYSPMQNIRACEERPDVLVVVATEDERAIPSAAYKYVAAMQASVMSKQVVLLRTVEGEGHTEWPWSVTVQVLIEELHFLFQSLSNKGGQAITQRKLR